MSEINNERVTQIVDVELLDESVKLTEETSLSAEEIEEQEKLKDEVFEKLKDALLEEKRLIGRFYDFCEEHTHFEYDELGMNMEEGEDILRKTDKIRDKFLSSIEEKLLYIFENVETNTLTRIITFDLDTKEIQYKVILEVFEDSFNLEIQ